MKHILIGKHMKKIFFQVVVITIFILAIYTAIVRWILGITLVLVIGLLIWIFRCNWNDDYRMIEKFGKDYKAAISNGKLGLRTLYPCRPDSYYTSKSAIEKMISSTVGRDGTDSQKATARKEAEDYIEKTKAVALVDPCEIDKLVKALDEEITEFETNIDYALSESNSTTKISLED